jgi:ABC-type transport system involved in multi-copper enzyme maturation permease subunit
MPIFDQGYQHWQGTLSGHGWRWLTIARQGVRTNLRNRWIRILTLGSLIPSVGLVAVLVLWGFLEQQAEFAQKMLSIFFDRDLLDQPGATRIMVWTLAFDIFFKIQLYVAMVLILLVGPNLVSQDLRFNAIPLYFSRPLRRFDYFLGKLGVIAGFLGMVMIVPAVLAWVLGVIFSLKMSIIADTWRLPLGGIGYGLVVAISAGLFVLALSSLTRNSRYVSAMWIGVWLFTLILSSALTGIHISMAVHEAHRQTMQEVHWPAQPVFSNDPRERVAQQEEYQKKLQEYNERMNQLQRRSQEVIAEALRDDWRPLVSYPTNLQRVGSSLIGAPAAWARFYEARSVFFDTQMQGPGKPMRAHRRERPSAEVWESQVSVGWSVLILVALGGLSVWILSWRVKTLDRLT